MTNGKGKKKGRMKEGKLMAEMANRYREPREEQGEKR